MIIKIICLTNPVQRGDSLDYLLRDVSEELWRKAKAKATLQGFNMRQLLTFLLEAWVDDKIGLAPEKKATKAGTSS